MIKKNSILSSLLLILYFPNAHAITEQISAAKNYLLKKQTNINTHSLSPLNINTSQISLTEDNNTINFENDNDDIVIDQKNTNNKDHAHTINYKESYTIEQKNKALAPIKELKNQQQSNVLKVLQQQLSLPVTGIMDNDTINYMQSFQQQNAFNMTKSLDYNTWFALFEQNITWQTNTIDHAEKIWQNVLDKQIVNNTSKFIVVNIPTMTLTGYEWDGINAKEVISSKVVVGKSSTQTPIKDFDVISIKYNPTWTPTTNMLKRGAYKNGQLNINWIKSHGLQVLDSNNHVVSYDNIVLGKQYRFQQPAGDNNALGILKFETNSLDNIYLHDTNEKHYFKYNTRAYSSGCIRVQDFRDLANWLKNNTDVDEKLKRKDTYYEKVTKTPVYITYTQVIFYDSEPLFAPDVYQINNNTQFEK